MTRGRIAFAVSAVAAVAALACTSFRADDAPVSDAGVDPGDGAVVPDGGTVSLEGGVARARVGRGNGQRAYLRQRFSVPSGARFDRGTLRFTLADLVELPSNSYAEIGCGLRLELGDSRNATSVRLEFYGGGDMAIDEAVTADGGDVASGSGPLVESFGAVPARRTVTLDIRRDGGSVVTAARTQSTSGAAAEALRTSLLLIEPDRLEVRCGILYASTDAGFSLVFDDVDVELCYQ